MDRRHDKDRKPDNHCARGADRCRGAGRGVLRLELAERSDRAPREQRHRPQLRHYRRLGCRSLVASAGARARNRARQCRVGQRARDADDGRTRVSHRSSEVAARPSRIAGGASAKTAIAAGGERGSQGQLAIQCTTAARKVGGGTADQRTRHSRWHRRVQESQARHRRDGGAQHDHVGARSAAGHTAARPRSLSRRGVSSARGDRGRARTARYGTPVSHRARGDGGQGQGQGGRRAADPARLQHRGPQSRPARPRLRKALSVDTGVAARVAAVQIERASAAQRQHLALREFQRRSRRQRSFRLFQGDAGRACRLHGRRHLASARVQDIAGFVHAKDKVDDNDTPKEAGEKRPGGKVLSQRPYNFERLNVTDADVRFKGKQVAATRLPLDDVEAHFKLENGHLTIDPLNFGVAGGTIASRLTLDARKNPMDASLDLRARRLQLGKLIPSLEEKVGVGTLTGRGNLKGTGNSVASLLGSADGEVAAIMSGGYVSKLLLKLSYIDLANSVPLLFAGDEKS